MQPTDRIFFDGHYHKDVFFDGHYHKEAWLNGVCVWRKKKGTLIKNISMLSYVNGRYYAVVETADYMSSESFPVLYEGASLNRMHEKGKIFGDEPVRGNYYIMYADSDELTVIRTHNISERHIARISINENGADMGNISYDIESGVYRFSNYTNVNDRYYYGNGNNYYYGSNEGFYKNDNKLEGAMVPFICTGNKLVSTYSITANTSEFDGNLQFKTFDENEEFHTYNINLRKVLENARELLIDKYKWNVNQARNITLSNILRVSIGYVYIAMVSNSTGYVLIAVTLRNIIGNSSYIFEKYYKLKINFSNSTLLEAKAVDSYKDYTFYSQMIGNDKYHVQIAGKRTTISGIYTSGISYGLIDDDYENDVFIYRGQISNASLNFMEALSESKICSLAYDNDALFVKISNSVADRYEFILIDTKNQTARYIEEIDMYAE